MKLTATEFRLLESLAIRPGVAKSRKALTGIIGDDQSAISRTLDTHIARLRRKFRALDDTFSEIDTVHNTGYRFSRSKEYLPLSEVR